MDTKNKPKQQHDDKIAPRNQATDLKSSHDIRVVNDRLWTSQGYDGNGDVIYFAFEKVSNGNMMKIFTSLSTAIGTTINSFAKALHDYTDTTRFKCLFSSDEEYDNFLRWFKQQCANHDTKNLRAQDCYAAKFKAITLNLSKGIRGMIAFQEHLDNKTNDITHMVYCSSAPITKLSFSDRHTQCSNPYQNTELTLENMQNLSTRDNFENYRADFGHIIMSVSSSMTSRNQSCLVASHMGIFRSPMHFLKQVRISPRISMQLHGFAALCEMKHGRSLQVNAPSKLMWKMLHQALGQYHIRDLTLTTERRTQHIAPVNEIFDNVLKCSLKQLALFFPYGNRVKHPLTWAATKNKLTLAQQLLEYTPNPEVIDADGNTALILAAVNGHIEMLELLLNAGARINHRGRYKRSALHFAVINMKLDAVHCLLKYKANVNIKDRDGHTPLIEAAQRGHTDIADALLSASADISISGKEHRTAPHLAVAYNQPNMLKLLIERAKSSIDFEHKDYYKDTMLTTAASYGHLQLMEILLDLGANVDARGQYLRTALHCAVMLNNVPMLNLLVKHNVNTENRDKYGDTAFTLAIYLNRAELAEKLLLAKANIDAIGRDGQSALNLAINNYSTDAMRVLLKHKVNKEIMNKDGDTPLTLAMRLEQFKFGRMLIADDANINVKGQYGETALILAVKYKVTKMVKCLLDNKADPEIKDDNGDTPLTIAAYQGNNVSIELLCAAGVNINTKGQYLRSPLVWSIISKRIKTVDLLLKNKALTEITDQNGDTALTIAAHNGSIEIAEHLLLAKSQINAAGQLNRTPLAWAARKNKPGMLRLLLKYNADIKREDKHGDSPLALAARSGHVDSTKILLNSKAMINVQNKEKRTPLVQATAKNEEKMVKFLLDNKANTETQDTAGNTSLIIAAQHGYVTIAKMLIQFSANVYHASKDGQTALAQAITNKHYQMIQVLQGHDATEIQGSEPIMAKSILKDLLECYKPVLLNSRGIQHIFSKKRQSRAVQALYKLSESKEKNSFSRKEIISALTIHQAYTYRIEAFQHDWKYDDNKQLENYFTSNGRLWHQQSDTNEILIYIIKYFNDCISEIDEEKLHHKSRKKFRN